MKKYFEENYIEKVINNQEFIGNKEMRYIKQLLVSKIIEDISKGTFNRFGEVISYKLNKEAIDDLSRLSCYEINAIEYPLVVMKYNEKILITEVQEVNSVRGYINTSGLLSYIENNRVTMPNYVKDEEFSRKMKELGLILTNEEEEEMNNGSMKHILSILNEVLSRDNVVKKIEEHYNKKSFDIRQADIYNVVQNFIYDKSEYMDKKNIAKLSDNDFLKLNRDLFIYDLARTISRNIIYNSIFKDKFEAIKIFQEDKDRFIKIIDDNIENIITDNSVSYTIAKFNKKEKIVVSNLELADIAKKVCHYNNYIDTIVETMKDSIFENIRTCTPKSVNIRINDDIFKVDNRFFASGYYLAYKDTPVQIKGIVGFAGRNQKWILDPTDLKSFSVEYRNKPVYTISKECLDELNRRLQPILDAGVTMKVTKKRIV